MSVLPVSGGRAVKNSLKESGLIMNKTPFEMAVVNYFFEHDYHDRGMLKWQGFYLSDHTAALKEMKKGISNEK